MIWKSAVILSIEETGKAKNLYMLALLPLRLVVK